MAALGNQFVISLQDGTRQIGALEEAAVDEEILLGIAFLGRSRAADESVDACDRRVGIDIQQVLLDVPSHDIDDPAGQRCGLQVVDRGVVGVQFEADLRVAECNTLELRTDLRRRGRALVEEPAAGRHIVKEIAHEELRTHGAHDRGLRNELPAVDFGLRSHLVALLARAQFDLRHRGDRGQGLSPESERMQGIDIFHAADLARGMAVEGHAGIDGRHAATVVDDLDQVLAAVAEVDLHGPGPRIERIFHHLLHHRSGPVDHLTRRDLIGDDFG